jgi:hypothetical protein
MDASDIREGSAVHGIGYLIEGESGEVQLCMGGGRLVDPPTCSVVAVRVDGVKWDAVPGAQEVAGRWFASNVSVTGTWTGSSVVAESITAAPPEDAESDIKNPCEADEGDGAGLGTVDEETALKALGDEVFGHPDRYAGLWRAHSRDGLGRIVVGVVGDPSSAQSILRPLYPYPLCVVAVAHTETDLELVLKALGASTRDWLAEVDYPDNRVRVSVALLKNDVQRRLQPYFERILVRELLEPV